MNYPGSKNGSGVYQKIINLMPPHEIYIEGFLGSGAIMRNKRPAPLANIGIDADIDAINMFDAKIPALELVHGDFKDFFIGICPTENTLIYLDPPYLMETRSSQKKIYKHEFCTREEHYELLNFIDTFECYVLISGYYSDLYADLLHDWRLVQFTAQTRSGPATECVWCNFPEPVQLHDYSFLGDDFRQRERIKRKKLRWSNRLKTMDPQERYAILSVMQDIQETPS
jgi:site-specific DNA-adenine methylase